MERTATGRRRYRVEKRFARAPLLVLQIEEKYLHTYNVGGYIDSDWCVGWRDARPEDITTHERTE